ncbi:MAG: DinB family protein [Bacteroidia bacterium]
MIYKENWKQEINTITEEFKKSFSNLTQEQLNWKPAPDVWSIGQIIDHLLKTNESFFPAIQNLNSVNRSIPFTGRIGFIVNFFGNLIYKGVEPTRSKKTRTFPVWEPTTSSIPSNILKQYEENQQMLMKLIDKNQNNFNKILTSPANKNVVYKFGKAIDIFIAHQKRHYNQAMEVYELIKEKNI